MASRPTASRTRGWTPARMRQENRKLHISLATHTRRYQVCRKPRLRLEANISRNNNGTPADLSEDFLEMDIVSWDARNPMDYTTHSSQVHLGRLHRQTAGDHLRPACHELWGAVLRPAAGQCWQRDSLFNFVTGDPISNMDPDGRASRDAAAMPEYNSTGMDMGGELSTLERALPFMEELVRQADT